MLLLVSAYLGLSTQKIPQYGQSDKGLHFIAFFLLTVSPIPTLARCDRMEDQAAKLHHMACRRTTHSTARVGSWSHYCYTFAILKISTCIFYGHISCEALPATITSAIPLITRYHHQHALTQHPTDILLLDSRPPAPPHNPRNPPDRNSRPRHRLRNHPSPPPQRPRLRPIRHPSQRSRLDSLPPPLLPLPQTHARASSQE